MKPRIAILTTLTDFSPAYSLTGIILDQAAMLGEYGYPYDLLCLKNFKRKGEDPTSGPELAESRKIRVKYVLPQTQLHDYKPNEPPKKDFEDQVDKHFQGFKEILEPYDVVISHDIMFLSWFLPQNKALRQCIEMWPDKTWLHWVHSGPSFPKEFCYPSDLRYSAAINSYYVYLNESQKLDYSLMIQVPKKFVYTVYNPKDIRDVYKFSDLTCDIIKRYDLFDHDVLQIYPFSSPRWGSKGVKQLLKIFGAWKEQRVHARLVLVNAHCNTLPKDQQYVDAIISYAKDCGLIINDDVILTSNYADEKENKRLRFTVPFQTVRELFLMSNLFIFPSASECCSLVQAEASISGGVFMVLNKDFQPMSEFCTSNVMSYDFTRNDPDRNPTYYENVAREIWANMRQDATIMNTTRARNKTYNKDWIFKTQLENLLYLNFAKRKQQEAEILDMVRIKEGQERKIPIDVNFESQEGSYENPQDGMDCSIFGKCDQGHREDFCFKQAGHCLMLDELKVEK